MIKVRLKRVRADKCQRNRYSFVEYSDRILTHWIEVSGEGPLREIEDAVKEINARRLRHPEKNDYYVLDVDTSDVDTLEDFKDLLNDIDRGFRGHEEVIGSRKQEEKKPRRYKR